MSDPRQGLVEGRGVNLVVQGQGRVGGQHPPANPEAVWVLLEPADELVVGDSVGLKKIEKFKIVQKNVFTDPPWL